MTRASVQHFVLTHLFWRLEFIYLFLCRMTVYKSQYVATVAICYVCMFSDILYFVMRRRSSKITLSKEETRLYFVVRVVILYNTTKICISLFC